MTNEQNHHRINRWLRFLRWFCPARLYEGIEGDLLEEYEEDLKALGEKRALDRLRRNVFRFFRSDIILRNRLSTDLIGITMWRNYFITGYRSILRRKLYSAINAFGLSVAIAFCSLIYLFVQDERSFDQFEENKDQIVMLNDTGFNKDKFNRGDKDPYISHPYLPAALGERLLEEVPEVERMTRFQNWGEGTMIYRDKVFLQHFTYVDSGFFKMFSFPIIEGNPNKVFSNPSDAVLTPEVARKFFGDEDPVGKVFTLTRDSTITMRVVAVIQAPPANSSINFEMLVPLQFQRWFKQNEENWGNFSYPTFVQLRKGADRANFKTRLDSVQTKYMGDKLREWRKDEGVPHGYKVAEFGFAPLSKVHLNTKVDWDKSSDPKYAWILGGIALLIMLIACINYVSLALTTSASRRIEVGVRKVAGAPGRQLMLQFSFESILLSLVSMAIGVLLVVLILPTFNTFTSKGIALNGLVVWQGVIVMILISVVIGLLAGGYPAFFLSRILPARVLKGGSSSRLKAGFSRPLVVIQFLLSGCMIISTVIMYLQMEFITTRDLGYDRSQLIAVETQAGWTSESDRTITQVRNKLQSEPYVVGVTGTTASFARGWTYHGFKTNGVNHSTYVYGVDPQYVSLLGIKLKEGRNFDPAIASDSNAVLVNEALARDMSWENPLDEYLNWQEDSLHQGDKVIGVLKDYNFLSLEHEVAPMLLTLSGGKNDHLTTMIIKLTAGHLTDGVDRVGKAWRELYPDRPFEYSFVDDDVAKQYDSDQRWMKITGVSTILAIVIACMGLFGLAGINAVNRTKEVGIRKVMGAGLSSIFLLMNREYILLALMAFGLAVPISWYGMTHWWLSGFEYHINPGWEIFVGSVTGGLLISLLTVSYHGIKAALMNPAETLKYE